MKSTTISFTPRRFPRSNNTTENKGSLGNINNKSVCVKGSNMAKHHSVSRTSTFANRDNINNDDKYKKKPEKETETVTQIQCAE